MLRTFFSTCGIFLTQVDTRYGISHLALRNQGEKVPYRSFSPFLCGVRIDPHKGAEGDTMELETVVMGGFAIAFAVAVVCCIACCFKSSGAKKSEHDARMTEYANKAIEHNARMEDFSRKAEEHEWKRADRDSEMKLNEVRLQKEIALKEQEILKLQKELQYKKDHPEKFSEWHPEDED